jgi:hypothetical protein
MELARERALTFLESFKTVAEQPSRDLLVQVARTSLRTKVWKISTFDYLL